MLENNSPIKENNVVVDSVLEPAIDSISENDVLEKNSPTKESNSPIVSIAEYGVSNNKFYKRKYH